jgi:hypothetical protein
MIIECDVCATVVETDEVACYDCTNGEENSTKRQILVKCRRCNNTMLTMQDNIGNVLSGDVWDSPVRLWPLRETQLNTNIPDYINEIYEEALKCFCAKAYSATIILSKKTLKCISKNMGINEKDLASSLKMMKKKNIINDELYIWADKIGFLSDEKNLEDSEKNSFEQSKDVIDFLDALLKCTYSIKHDAKEDNKKEILQNV